ncbi:MAG: hypothetical protein KKG43_02240 [Candidatus Omnitrophica bacterium]|nr:hypothetical protein [Candidatus Omnitrophota bacterium]MBU1929019.1 hypothetical protein [Candidatus Omnitrophota bacterium]MBU2035665.1 hypothetical protein [Candidatus Omnitrophota bacterium]MBU2221102.1 hypothetical protein [Candidatus Omnitrophota bacterium]MBU2258446.1 hypothetical protein [Candidatus Omnitrophota bacterium]
MVKKRVYSVIALVLLLAILSGCETCKLTAQGITQGLPQDARNTWQSIIRADDWVKKNLW